jgi:ring-1,2-phenylacetyl-CoA epoxidase subunit PaaD
VTGASAAERDRAWQVAAQVMDPEIPVISIADLGILRDIEVREDGSVEVTITPTYSGCPAVDAISDILRESLAERGFAPVTVRTALAPAWTTDWITPQGRAALSAYGIAPPAAKAGPVSLTLRPRCPLCGSPETVEVSHFGSTSCKSLWRCTACEEPFEHFKAF